MKKLILFLRLMVVLSVGVFSFLIYLNKTGWIMIPIVVGVISFFGSIFLLKRYRLEEVHKKSLDDLKKNHSKKNLKVQN